MIEQTDAKIVFFFDMCKFVGENMCFFFLFEKGRCMMCDVRCMMLDFLSQQADLDKIAHPKIKNLFFLDDIFRYFLAYFKKIL